ncbi:hypothetical protein B0T22DRAFT_436221 [Podospora appendiculata]|uniref:Uncharacterized protein n=1 Tax=Podospora appendiculata TaxID=314037 RepID=A0AAE0XGN5_9PEZI|nr:hypothetical protein B0T22DRAFT_436221 [Podospora appendiculata]
MKRTFEDEDVENQRLWEKFQQPVCQVGWFRINCFPQPPGFDDCPKVVTNPTTACPRNFSISRRLTGANHKHTCNHFAALATSNATGTDAKCRWRDHLVPTPPGVPDVRKQRETWGKRVVFSEQMPAQKTPDGTDSGPICSGQWMVVVYIWADDRKWLENVDVASLVPTWGSDSAQIGCYKKGDGSWELPQIPLRRYYWAQRLESRHSWVWWMADDQFSDSKLKQGSQLGFLTTEGLMRVYGSHEGPSALEPEGGEQDLGEGSRCTVVELERNGPKMEELGADTFNRLQKMNRWC